MWTHLWIPNQSRDYRYSDIETANLKFITPRISPTCPVADRRFGFYGGSVLTHDDGNPLDGAAHCGATDDDHKVRWNPSTNMPPSLRHCTGVVMLSFPFLYCWSLEWCHLCRQTYLTVQKRWAIPRYRMNLLSIVGQCDTTFIIWMGATYYKLN